MYWHCRRNPKKVCISVAGKGRSTTHKAIVEVAARVPPPMSTPPSTPVDNDVVRGQFSALQLTVRRLGFMQLSEDQQSICLNIIHKLLVKFKPILLPARENNT
ncbi:unnamed protein product [Sphagnum balticum]